MNEMDKRKGGFDRLVRSAALALALVMVWQIVSPSTLRIIGALAEEGSPLSKIYGILSDSAGEPETAADYLERASISIGQRAYDKALSELETARGLTQESDHAMLSELWLKTSSVYVLTGSMDEAASALDQALAENPASTQALLLRAQIAIERADHQAAATDLARYLEVVPSDTATRQSLAQLLEAMGAYAEAAAQYGKVYELIPQDESHLLNALRCRFLCGEYETALAGFDDYLARHAQDEADAFGGIADFLRAACLMQLGDYAQAGKGFEQAIAKGYDEASCLEQITLCRYETGDHAGVIAAGEKLLAMQGAVIAAPEMVYQRMGVSYLRQENYEQALAYFDKVREGNAQAMGNEYYRGVCLLTLGRNEEAVEAFTASIESGYLTQFCYYNRGVAYVDLLEYELAIEDMAMTLETGDDAGLIEAAKDILWQLAAYFEQLEAAQSGETAEPTADIEIEEPVAIGAQENEEATASEAATND